MAKKRGVRSPLGNTAGAQEAEANAAKAGLETLSHQLSTELDKSGEDPAEFLKSHFGIEAVNRSVEWKLASGSTATFNEVTLSYEQVRDDTTVTFDVNGRDQSQLNEASLSDLDSLAFQQFYPAVGRETRGKIDVLDGSRRRAWFLLQQGKVSAFRMLVTRDDISVSDAKALAKQLQTAREHNQREIGLQCRTIMQSGNYTQQQVAEIVGISRPAVSKALKAAGIDERLIALFPVVNELSHTDYTALDAVMKQLGGDEKALSHFISQIEQQKEALPLDELASDEIRDALIVAVKKQLKIETAKQKDPAEVTPLAEFKSKGVFARKRVKGRNFSYEFGRLPASVQQELDEAVLTILSEYQGDS
ncbi:TPA: chromosome partitioning protein ParB [Vibrio parahaemolyticus]|jgi:ParB family chromosome partitioning protein|uniref:ParB family protein n=1 Tax=Vibrio TaxID=662 RepID=UPI001CDB84E8|nr:MULTISPECIES: ParB family protein [Vibrio]MCA2494168.1 chromosome partitioning protein ParB [Vibrio alginolyticus]MDW2221130.1 ParB family protein [Vibrio sp. 2175-1]HCH1012824.1 chromosome partitioning protein ParB [Vibrio parahaemolyticus]